MLTIKTSPASVRHQQKKADDQSGGSNNEVDNHDGAVNEILKTSRYHPDEQVVGTIRAMMNGNSIRTLLR